MANGKFAGGNGTLENPYLIEDAHDLNAIRDNLKTNYKIVKDIDLDIEPYNQGDGWKPISGFSGTLDGGFHKIKNLYIDRPDEMYVGLFGHLNDTEEIAKIEYLTLVTPKITGGGYTGSVIGRISKDGVGVEVEGVGVISAEIVGKDYTGGCIGATSAKSIVSSCHFSGEVLGSNRTGAIAGNNNGIIKHSIAKGKVSARSGTVGGFCGQSFDGNSRIENCLSTVECEVGFSHTRGKGTIVDCYWNKDVAGSLESEGIGITSEEMESADFFVERKWDEIKTINHLGETTEVWSLEEGKVPSLWIIGYSIQGLNTYLFKTPEGLWRPTKESYERVDDNSLVNLEQMFNECGTISSENIIGKIRKTGVFSDVKELEDKKIGELEIGGFEKIRLENIY